MKEFKKHFTYEIMGELSYIKDGEPIFAKTLSIKAPTNKELSDVCLLEQEYEKSQLKQLESLKKIIGEKEFSKKINKEEKSNKEEKKVTCDDVVKHLMGGDSDIDKCFRALKNILTAGTQQTANCRVDETTKLSNDIYNDLSFIDIKCILGEYIVNFIIASQDA